MQLTAAQKAAAQAIVNIFETGSIRGDYGNVTLLPGDSGQLTYGRSQTTLASGNLHLLIQDYCARNDGAFSAALEPYLPFLEARDISLNSNLAFRGLLRDAGDDPVMQEVQDDFFDRVYWEPAMRSADAIGAETALGATIVYDSVVHGSWAHVRDLTRREFGELANIGEQKWMSDYVDTRRDWLAAYPNPLLHKTVYRMNTFRDIINSRNWKLGLPFTVRGFAITPDSLANTVPVKVPAEGVPRRLLRLKSPPMTGPDVTWLQGRLTQAGIKVADSGTFDSATDAAVRAFQEANDLKVDGIVGPVTRAALEDIPVLQPKLAGMPPASEPMPAVPQPQPAAPAGDAVADIKTHVSNEVKTRLVVPGAVKARARPAKTAARLTRVSLKGYPGIAATLSALMLAFTEARDAIVWVVAGPWSMIAKPGASGTALPALPSLPRSSADLPRFLSDAYAYLHALAALLPNEWVFRLRIVAFVLLCYALYRLITAHVDVQKLQSGLMEGEKVVRGVTEVADSIKSMRR